MYTFTRVTNTNTLLSTRRPHRWQRHYYDMNHLLNEVSLHLWKHSVSLPFPESQGVEMVDGAEPGKSVTSGLLFCWGGCCSLHLTPATPRAPRRTTPPRRPAVAHGHSRGEHVTIHSEDTMRIYSENTMRVQWEYRGENVRLVRRSESGDTMLKWTVVTRPEQFRKRIVVSVHQRICMRFESAMTNCGKFILAELCIFRPNIV